MRAGEKILSAYTVARTLPDMKLFVYDHCPYCVKARMIFGFKDLPFEMVTLLNDDVETPTRMIGQKMVPILQTDDGTFMPESMDIIHHVDKSFGMPVLTGETNPEVGAWLQNTKTYLYGLCFPRWVKAPLEEFATKGAREFFTQKKEAMIGSFAENMQRTETYVEQANSHLKALAPLLLSHDAVNGKLSEDDIHLFAALRSLSIVKGVEYPDKVEAYRKRMAERSAVPLHDRIAA